MNATDGTITLATPCQRCGHSVGTHGRFYGRIGAGGRWSDHCRGRGCDCPSAVTS